MQGDGGGVGGDQLAVRRDEEIGGDLGQLFEAVDERFRRAQEAVVIRPGTHAFLQRVHVPELAGAVERRHR